MKLYRLITSILYIISIITMLIFIIWNLNNFNLIGFTFLILASVNMLIMEIIKKKRNRAEA